jgi:hypothetical protein
MQAKLDEASQEFSVVKQQRDQLHKENIAVKRQL